MYLYHFKPPYVEEIREELATTDLPYPARSWSKTAPTSCERPAWSLPARLAG